jgi:hypothetical protein
VAERYDLVDARFFQFAYGRLDGSLDGLDGHARAGAGIGGDFFGGKPHHADLLTAHLEHDVGLDQASQLRLLADVEVGA